ncbi:protein ALP1-like [Pararge aegeria]|uniref:protein ALP1-like n=1 Tax=Pararge aegeria TaxID=116150 RepID=UPI0019D23CAF|nr:protein ALP1-like [Pararge aegeria]
MESEDSLLALTIISASLLIIHRLLKKPQRPRRWWRTELYKRREGRELLTDMNFQHISGQYKSFTRMTPTDFENLLAIVGPRISRKYSNLRAPISAQDRLAITLRFLSSGDSYTSLQYTFRVSKQSISGIIPEVCSAIIEELKENIKVPTTANAWLKISKEFEDRWNFPHCIGALDGKHVLLQAPIKSGTEFYNYKQHFSIVLFALVDADYNFLFVDVGCQGRISDGGVFKDTQLYDKIENRTLDLPESRPLSDRNVCIPYFFLGDSAFALSEYLMKPYAGIRPKGSSKRIFNYRLSRARRVVENVFGIVSSVFRVLRKPMLLQPHKAELVVMAITLLHNYLKRHSTNVYMIPGLVDREEDGNLNEGTWRQNNNNITSILPVRNIPRRSPAHLNAIRDEFADYFMNEGKVSWQDRCS